MVTPRLTDRVPCPDVGDSEYTGRTEQEVIDKVSASYPGFESEVSDYVCLTDEGTYSFNTEQFKSHISRSFLAADQLLNCETQACQSNFYKEENLEKLKEARERYERDMQEMQYVAQQYAHLLEDDPVMKLLTVGSAALIGGFGVGVGFQVLSDAPLEDLESVLKRRSQFLREVYIRNQLNVRFNNDEKFNGHRQKMRACGFEVPNLSSSVAMKFVGLALTAMASLAALATVVGITSAVLSQSSDESVPLTENDEAPSRSGVGLPAVDPSLLDDLDISAWEYQLAQSLSMLGAMKNKRDLSKEVTDVLDRINRRLDSGNYAAAREIYEESFLPLSDQPEIFTDIDTWNQYIVIQSRLEEIFHISDTVLWLRQNPEMVNFGLVALGTGGGVLAMAGGGERPSNWMKSRYEAMHFRADFRGQGGIREITSHLDSRVDDILENALANSLVGESCKPSALGLDEALQHDYDFGEIPTPASSERAGIEEEEAEQGVAPEVAGPTGVLEEGTAETTVVGFLPTGLFQGMVEFPSVQTQVQVAVTTNGHGVPMQIRILDPYTSLQASARVGSTPHFETPGTGGRASQTPRFSPEAGGSSGASSLAKGVLVIGLGGVVLGVVQRSDLSVSDEVIDVAGDALVFSGVAGMAYGLRVDPVMRSGIFSILASGHAGYQAGHAVTLVGMEASGLSQRVPQEVAIVAPEVTGVLGSAGAAVGTYRAVRANPASVTPIGMGAVVVSLMVEEGMESWDLHKLREKFLAMNPDPAVVAEFERVESVLSRVYLSKRQEDFAFTDTEQNFTAQEMAEVRALLEFGTVSSQIITALAQSRYFERKYFFSTSLSRMWGMPHRALMAAVSSPKASDWSRERAQAEVKLAQLEFENPGYNRMLDLELCQFLQDIFHDPAVVTLENLREVSAKLYDPCYAAVLQARGREIFYIYINPYVEQELGLRSGTWDGVVQGVSDLFRSSEKVAAMSDRRREAAHVVLLWQGHMENPDDAGTPAVDPFAVNDLPQAVTPQVEQQAVRSYARLKLGDSKAWNDKTLIYPLISQEMETQVEDGQIALAGEVLCCWISEVEQGVAAGSIGGLDEEETVEALKRLTQLRIYTRDIQLGHREFDAQALLGEVNLVVSYIERNSTWRDTLNDL